MPRKPRIDFPGALYHVIARGNNRQPTYLDSQDYQTFLQCLTVAQERYPFSLYAYTLMTNHFHLLIETKEAPLALIMRSLLIRYARAFNRRHKRIGHLFSARYKAILCQKETYLLELIRYIHLNPVRAAMTKTPSAWLWSSHQIYLGKVSSSRMDTQFVLSQFSKNKRRAYTAYERFVREGLRQGQRADLYPPETMPLLGDASFIEQVTSERKALRRNPSTRLRLSLPQLAHRITSLLKIDPEALHGIRRDRVLSKARALLVYFAVQHARHPMSRVAEFLQLHPSSITKALRRANRELLKDDADIKKIFQALEHKSSVSQV